jgi:hypothetical protein
VGVPVVALSAGIIMRVIVSMGVVGLMVMSMGCR